LMQVKDCQSNLSAQVRQSNLIFLKVVHRARQSYCADINGNRT